MTFLYHEYLYYIVIYILYGKQVKVEITNSVIGNQY
jgi:hypothetical protein